MQVCGVDEAGRGSMLGPLVVAGVSISKSKVNLLKKLGVGIQRNFHPRQGSTFTRKLLK